MFNKDESIELFKEFTTSYDLLRDTIDKNKFIAAFDNTIQSRGYLAYQPDVKFYVTQENRAVVHEAIKNLEFDVGKATIRDHSYESLDKLSVLLIKGL